MVVITGINCYDLFNSLGVGWVREANKLQANTMTASVSIRVAKSPMQDEKLPAWVQVEHNYGSGAPHRVTEAEGYSCSRMASNLVWTQLAKTTAVRQTTTIQFRPSSICEVPKVSSGVHCERRHSSLVLVACKDCDRALVGDVVIT